MNFWIGCSKAGPECLNCYAENYARRFRSEVQWVADGNRSLTTADNWRNPERWQRAAARSDEQGIVFTNSLSDFFEDHVQLVPWRREALDVIRACDLMDWMLLTKRP